MWSELSRGERWWLCGLAVCGMGIGVYLFFASRADIGTGILVALALLAIFSLGSIPWKGNISPTHPYYPPPSTFWDNLISSMLWWFAFFGVVGLVALWVVMFGYPMLTLMLDVFFGIEHKASTGEWVRACIGIITVVVVPKRIWRALTRPRP